MNKERRILRNIIYAFAAQGISLLLSLLTSLILPKFFDKVNYGYWSLFIFYTGYTGFFHFGLNDGVYLKIGGIEYEDMDKGLLGGQFWFGAFFQSVIGAAIMAYALVSNDGQTGFVLIMTALYMVLYNLTLYLGCIFQAANETRLYSMSVMIDKIVFMASIIILFVIGSGDYRSYVYLYMLGKLAAMVYCVYKGREVVFVRPASLSVTMREAFDSIKIGVNLMVANIAGNLILGAGRFIIDRFWGIEDFGEVSFSLTLTNFFLLFVSQISMVLFPALRQVDDDKRRTVFDRASDGLNILLPIVFLIYIPAKEILRLWLPQYEVSLSYMAILLPMCIFDGKMNLLCGTYFKVLRQERFLLFVNLVSMAVSAALSLFGAAVLKSIDSIIVFMVVAIGVRYFISQYYLNRQMKENGDLKGLFMELVLVLVCSSGCFRLGSGLAFLLCLAAYAVYIALNKKSAQTVFSMVLGVVKKRNGAD